MGRRLFHIILERQKIPAVNISETDKTYLVEVAAPGMEKKDFHVSIEEGMLTISTEKEEKKTEKKKNYHRQEYSFESFERCFRLPDNVKTEDVQAKYDNGILKISLEKTKVKEPAKIEIAVA